MKTKFSWRAFISFGLTYSIIFILISGVVLYMSPPGRYAHWVNWKLLGFSKEGWQAIHTVFSYTFVILSVFHLFTINWKAFLSYFKKKTENGLNKKREFYISTILTVLFFFGIIFSVPPFKNVMDFGEYLTASWETAEEAAPVPHAELFTLTELAEEMRLSSVNEITNKLEKHNIKFDNTSIQTLAEIAEVNNTTPLEIYSVISKKESLQQRQGTGIGRKTIEEFAKDAGKTVDEALKILKEKNIDAQKGQTLREIGNNNNISPRDILKLLEQ